MFVQLSVLPVMQLVLIQSSEVFGGGFWVGFFLVLVVWVFFFSGGGARVGGKALETGGGGRGGVHLCIRWAEYDPCPKATNTEYCQE